MSAREDADTVIVGAGAAGLAAANELASNGQRVLVLEARARAGGRILTDSTHASVPLELGAEFIHGESPAILRWLAASGDVAIDAARGRWVADGGKLRDGDDDLRELRRALGRLSAPTRDMPFAEFLLRHRRTLSPAVDRLARRMVEGFDAADVSRISARSVLEEWSGPAAVSAPTFRPGRGYGALIQAMRNTLPADRAALHFDTAVRAIAWRKGRVAIEAQRYGQPVHIEASRAIVTLPLGVLQLPAGSPHAIRFTPDLRRKRSALARLASGPVIKLVMNFVRPFWADLHDGRYRDAAFFFANDAAFPTFWTTLPVRSSVLVAWCAGSNATRLADKSDREIVTSAFDSLRAIFGRRDYAALLEHVAWHDWQRDPFSCGAYSYVLSGGAGARRSLAEPIDDTLYFAGEACDTDGESATVGGALQSGLRAAQRLLASATSRRRRSSTRH